MLVIDKLLTGGIRFVLDKVMVAVDQELDDDTALREQLLAAQLQQEQGELTAEEFTALEDQLLARIREVRERRGEAQGPLSFGDPGDEDGERVEASFIADDLHENLDPVPAEEPAQEKARVPKRRKARVPRRR